MSSCLCPGASCARPRAGMSWMSTSRSPGEHQGQLCPPTSRAIQRLSEGAEECVPVSLTAGGGSPFQIHIGLITQRHPSDRCAVLGKPPACLCLAVPTAAGEADLPAPRKWSIAQGILWKVAIYLLPSLSFLPRLQQGV